MRHISNKKQTSVVLKEDQVLTIKVVSQDAIEITVEERKPRKRQTHILWKILGWIVKDKFVEVCQNLCKAIIEGDREEEVHIVNQAFDKVIVVLFNWDFIIIGWCVFIYIFVLYIVIRNTCSVNSFLGHSERRKSSTCKK